MTVPLTPTRRVVLVGSAAVLAGCSLDRSGGAKGPPPPHPDLVLADEAAARERAMLAAYDAALALVPQLADRLAPVRAEHAEHLAALGVPDPVPSAPPAPASAPPPALPAEPGALLAALADLERSTSVTHAGAAVHAGRGLAVVLASAAASEASHPLALR